MFEMIVTAPVVELDHPVALIARGLRPRRAVDVGAVLDQFDALAVELRGSNFATLCEGLFGSGRFRGNLENYGDPENSLIDAVLERGLGIPIMLGVVAIEVGRRIGVRVQPIGMPGHFLIQDAASGSFCDPFHGSDLLGARACKALHDGVFRGRRMFSERDLAAVTVPAVLSRILNNLEQSSLANDREQLELMLLLHSRIPTLSSAEYLSIATRLDAIGRPSGAGNVAERVVTFLRTSDANSELLHAAQTLAARFWARSN